MSKEDERNILHSKNGHSLLVSITIIVKQFYSRGNRAMLDSGKSFLLML